MSNEREQDSATRKVEDEIKTFDKLKIPEAEEAGKRLFHEINLPTGLDGSALFTSDMIEATIHEQLQLLYRQGEIHFDPDKPQNRSTTLLNFNQLKTLVTNVLQECEKQIEEELENDDAFQEFLELHNMPKLGYLRENKNV